MKTISRRNFVATAAAVSAGAIFRAPAFALGDQSPVARSTTAFEAVDHEAVVPQARPFPIKNVRLQPGVPAMHPFS